MVMNVSYERVMGPDQGMVRRIVNTVLRPAADWVARFCWAGASRRVAIAPTFQRGRDQRERLARDIPHPTVLRGACLRDTDLRGVDLRYVHGLTAAQLKEAIVDEATRLPLALAAQFD